MTPVEKSIWMKRWRAENQERIKAYQKEWKAKNREAIKAYNKPYQDKYRMRTEVQQATRVRHLKKYYKMTPTEFNALWELQDGKCAICESKMKPMGRAKDAVAIDHNHQTNQVRGLLCRGCNHGIGCLKDSPEVLRNAAKYLDERGHYSEMQIGVTSHGK